MLLHLHTLSRGPVVLSVFAAAFAWCIGLRPGGGWYSASWAHRLQTEAFFRGTFALQPVPHGQMADWAWGNGSQHVWGLGVAFVRFPLEAMAKLAGGVGFPDRLTLLLAFTAVAAVLWRAFDGVRPWERVCLLALTAFTPAFVTLCRTRLSVYEESSAYACLWALLLAGLLLRLASLPSPRTFRWLAAAAGLGPFFRPTLVFTSLVTLALALPIVWRHRRSAVAGGLGLFALGPLALMATQYLRFGSPFETGQLLNVSYIPLDQFAKVFGYPYWDEPWRSAAAELFSSLFLATGWNGVDWYQSGIHPWQSETLRFREFYFSTFTPAVFVVLVSSWAAVAAAAAAGRLPADPRIGMTALWSAAVFAGLCAFYLWAPSMTSRYAVDFAPAIAMGIAGGFLLVFRSVDSRALSALAACAGGAWVLHDVAHAGISPTHATRQLVTADVVRAHLPRPTLKSQPLPDGYRCGDDPERFGVKFNGAGWAYRGDCAVDAGTTLFFAAPACIRVDVAAREGGGPLGPSDLAAVRAKIGLTELTRVRTEAGDGTTRLTFCLPAGRDAVESRLEVVYFGWMDPRLARPGAKPLRLLESAKITR